MRNWAAVMERQFQPAKHTRVGGVCLFEAGYTSSASGEEWRLTTQLILNRYAALPLPEWVIRALVAAS